MLLLSPCAVETTTSLRQYRLLSGTENNLLKMMEAFEPVKMRILWAGEVLRNATLSVVTHHESSVLSSVIVS